MATNGSVSKKEMDIHSMSEYARSRAWNIRRRRPFDSNSHLYEKPRELGMPKYSFGRLDRKTTTSHVTVITRSYCVVWHVISAAAAPFLPPLEVVVVVPNS